MYVLYSTLQSTLNPVFNCNFSVFEKVQPVSPEYSLLLNKPPPVNKKNLIPTKLGAKTVVSVIVFGKNLQRWKCKACFPHQDFEIKFSSTLFNTYVYCHVSISAVDIIISKEEDIFGPQILLMEMTSHEEDCISFPLQLFA